MSYQLIALDGGTIQLSWEYPYVPNTVVVADINDVDASGDNCAINLPTGNVVSTGVTLLFNNISLAPFSLQDSLGNTLTSIIPGQVLSVYLTDNSTVQGSWQLIPFGNGQSAIANLTLNSADGLIVFNPATITNPGGTVAVTLDTSLSGLAYELETATPGYLVVTSTTPNTYATTSIVAGSNIVIVSPDGTEGNTLISLSNNITGLSSLIVGNYNIAVQTITTVDQVSDIIVNSPNAAIILNGVSIDAATSTITGNISSPATAKGWCTFSDAFSPTSGSNVVVSAQYGVISSVVGTNGVFYTINFATPFVSSNYVVMVNLVRPFTATQVQFQAFVAEQQTNYCIVYGMDINGNYLPAIDGMMVAIFSN